MSLNPEAAQPFGNSSRAAGPDRSSQTSQVDVATLADLSSTAPGTENRFTSDDYITAVNKHHELRKEQDWEGALSAAELALEIGRCIYLPKDLKIAEIKELIGDCQIALQRPREALQSYNASIRIRQLLYGGQDIQGAALLESTGFAHLALGEHHEALEKFEQALSIREHEEPSLLLRRAALTFHLSEVYGVLGNQTLSDNLIVKAFNLILEVREETLYEAAGLLLSMGQSKATNGALDQAKLLLEQGLKFYERAEHWQAKNEVGAETGSNLQLLGVLLRRGLAHVNAAFGGPHAGERLLRKALADARKSGEAAQVEQIPALLLDIGELCYQSFKIQEVADFVEEAFQLLKGRKSIDLARAHELMATVDAGKGEIDASLMHMQQAVSMREEYAHLSLYDPALAAAYIRLAGMQLMRGELVEARDLVSNAENVYKRCPGAGSEIGRAHVDSTLGRIAKEEGNFAEAEEKYRTAIDKYESLHHSAQTLPLAETLVLLADLYVDLCRSIEAKALLQEADSLAERHGIDYHPLRLKITHELSRIFREEGDIEEAMKFEIKAQAIRTQLDLLTDGLLFDGPPPEER